MLRRLTIGFATVAVIAGVWACDSLSDPEKSSGENVNRVSGALSGAPGGAHVAIVWRSQYGLTLGSDAPVVDGRFTIDLAAPADELITGPEGYPFFGDAAFTGAWSVGFDASGLQVRTETGGSVGVDGSPLEAAYAGFIVYVDTNGNGKLDFNEAGTTTDTLVGGSIHYSLAYYRGGSSVDFEKLRGLNGVVPHAGYNLRFTDSADRWFPLDDVKLELKPSPMPPAVCERMTVGGLPSHFADDAGVSIRCAPDGRSYAVEACTRQDPATAICDTNLATMTGCSVGDGIALDAGAPAPANWPCTVPLPLDAGTGDSGPQP